MRPLGGSAAGDPELLTGVDDGWEVCLLKFMVDMIQTSFPGNMGDFRERGML